MNHRKPIISILGDSISSFSGYSTRGYDFYDRYIQREAGMTSVEDTWWMQVIHFLGGELGYNDSISGSTVSGNNILAGESAYRHECLGRNGRPDILLLQMGCNDWAYCVPQQEFKKAYKHTLQSICKMYPEVEIYCATLMRGMDPMEEELRFMNVDASISQRIYSNLIRECVKEIGEKQRVHLIDLEKYGVEYSTIDGIHPDLKGMKTFADLWIRELENKNIL